MNNTIDKLAEYCEVNKHTFKRYYYKKSEIKKIIIKLDEKLGKLK